MENGITALVVDDEPTICELLQDELTERGFICSSVSDGTSALQKLATESFDIVLLDLRLPGVSGIDILKQMPLNPRQTAVIVITAVRDVETAVNALKLGASDYIVKPFDLEKLNKSLHSALENKTKTFQSEYASTKSQSANMLDAIAQGVETRLDLTDRHSEMVIQGTVSAAMEMGINMKVIQEWVTSQLAKESKKNQPIQRLVNRLEASPALQITMGVTKPHQMIDKPSNS